MLKKTNLPPNPDVLVLLGGGTDGTTTPVFYTRERLPVFTRLAKRFPGTPLILSGGYSAWVKKPKFTEADVMRHYLVAHGIPPKRLFLEKYSRDTIGNAYFSKQIIKKHRSWKHILVLTTDGHVDRSRWIFNKVFGSGYTFTFVGTPSKISSFQAQPGRKRYEKYVTRLYALWFSMVRDGDDKKILTLLKRLHPSYSKSMTAKKIERQIIAAKQKLLGYTKLLK
jgi:uncharacterized SAM-binding protein YcdF (DUF218 family)